MIVPVSYNIRNLRVRKTTTVMTAFGIALTVAVMMSVLALVEGLRSAFRATAHPLNVLVMRKGATAEVVSNLNRETFRTLATKPGIARAPGGEVMASLEMITVINTLKLPDGRDGMSVNLRGVLPVAFSLRPQLTLVEGRQFQPGQRECVVGKSLAGRYPDAHIGRQIKFGRGDWTVVGIMDGDRSAVNSEVWADLNLVSLDYTRPQALSSALVRATDAAAMAAFANDVENDARFNVQARPERDYYASQTGSAAPVQYMGLFVAAIMAIGSSFAAMNTMYAAVIRRSAEIGTLRVLGFSQGGILLSFLIESVMLAMAGGVLACLLVQPLNHIHTQIGSFTTYNEIAFRFDVSPRIMLLGLTFAIVMGGAGGFLPARMAARREILAALRPA